MKKTLLFLVSLGLTVSGFASPMLIVPPMPTIGDLSSKTACSEYTTKLYDYIDAVQKAHPDSSDNPERYAKNLLNHLTLQNMMETNPPNGMSFSRIDNSVSISGFGACFVAGINSQSPAKETYFAFLQKVYNTSILPAETNPELIGLHTYAFKGKFEGDEACSEANQNYRYCSLEILGN